MPSGALIRSCESNDGEQRTASLATLLCHVQTVHAGRRTDCSTGHLEPFFIGSDPAPQSCSREIRTRLGWSRWQRRLQLATRRLGLVDASTRTAPYMPGSSQSYSGKIHIGTGLRLSSAAEPSSRAGCSIAPTKCLARVAGTWDSGRNATKRNPTPPR